MNTLWELDKFLGRDKYESIEPRKHTVISAVSHLNSAANVYVQFDRPVASEASIAPVTSYNPTTKPAVQEQADANVYVSTPSDQDLKDAIRIGQLNELINGLHAEIEGNAANNRIDLSQWEDK